MFGDRNPEPDKISGELIRLWGVRGTSWNFHFKEMLKLISMPNHYIKYRSFLSNKINLEFKLTSSILMFDITHTSFRHHRHLRSFHQTQKLNQEKHIHKSTLELLTLPQ